MDGSECLPCGELLGRSRWTLKLKLPGHRYSLVNTRMVVEDKLNPGWRFRIGRVLIGQTGHGADESMGILGGAQGMGVGLTNG